MAELAWALLALQTLTIVEVLTFGAMAAINAMIIITVV